ERFGRIGGCNGPSNTAARGGGFHRLDREAGKTDLKFAEGEALLVEGEFHAAVREQGGPGIVSVPHADDRILGGAAQRAGAWWWGGSAAEETTEAQETKGVRRRRASPRTSVQP